MRLIVLSCAVMGILMTGCGDPPPSPESLKKVWVEQLLKYGYSRSDNVAFSEGDNMTGFEKRAENEYYTPEHQVRVRFKEVEIKPYAGDIYSYSGVVRFERESPNSKAVGATYYLYGRRTREWVRKEESAMR